jgi:hypothetical protein
LGNMEMAESELYHLLAPPYPLQDGIRKVAVRVARVTYDTLAKIPAAEQRADRNPARCSKTGTPICGGRISTQLE